MTALEHPQAVAVPEQGNLVRVRDRFWVVESVLAWPGRSRSGVVALMRLWGWWTRCARGELESQFVEGRAVSRFERVDMIRDVSQAR